jgi:hypothetical protein
MSGTLQLSSGILWIHFGYTSAILILYILRICLGYELMSTTLRIDKTQMYSITPDISRYTSGILIGYILQLYTSAILRLYFGYILQLYILRLYVLQLYASCSYSASYISGILRISTLAMHACIYFNIAAILHVDVPWLYTLRAGILGIKLGYTSGILNSDTLQVYFGYICICSTLSQLRYLAD